MEFLKPDFLQKVLNFLSFKILHQVRDKLNILLSTLASISTITTTTLASLAALHYSHTGV